MMLLPAKMQLKLGFWKVLNFGLLLLLYLKRITAYTPRVLLPDNTIFLLIGFTVAYGVLLSLPKVLSKWLPLVLLHLLEHDLNQLFAGYTLLLTFWPRSYTLPNFIGHYGVVGGSLPLIALLVIYTTQRVSTNQKLQLTNLFSSRLLVLLGLAIMIAATETSKITLIVGITGLALIALLGIGYSRHLAKR